MINAMKRVSNFFCCKTLGHRKEGHILECTEIYIKGGSNIPVRETINGCYLCVEWKDGTTSWERMTDLKEINPIEAAKYASTQNIPDEPAFS
jgi:hypothetical protein